MKRLLLLIGTIGAIGGYFLATATDVLAAPQVEQGYCWCQKPDGGGKFICENHTKNELGEFIADRAECDAYCPKLIPKAVTANWDLKPSYVERSRVSCQLRDCPQVYGFCWCVSGDAKCNNHMLDDSCKPILSETVCESFCKSKGAVGRVWRPVNFPFVDYSKGDLCQKVRAKISGNGQSQQPRQTGSPINLYDPLGGHEDIFSFISRIIRAMLGIVGSVALLAFVYGGFLWLTSDMGEGQIKKAKTVLKSATIGLLIIFFSYMAVDLFLSSFRASYETDDGPTQQP